MPYLSTAARVSPPPAIENALDACDARARVWVPCPKASNSKTPKGTVPDHGAAARDHAGVATGGIRADIEDHLVVTNGVRPASPWLAHRREFRCDDHIGRHRDLGPARFCVGMICGSVSTRSGSYSDLPTRCPSAAMKVLRCPPTINWRLATRLDSQFQFCRDLGAGDDRQQRPCGIVKRLAVNPVLPSQQGRRRPVREPDHAVGGSLCTGAVPNASITNTSHNAA